ncbi:MAG: VanZ family protein [Nocardioides sp.]|nr:VanZ family protein [Nocardioides sp.]
MSDFVGGTESMVLYAVLTATVLFLVAWVLRRWVGWVTALAITGFLWSVVVIGLVTLVPLDGIDLTRSPETRSAQCSFDYGGPAPDGFWIFGGTQRMLNTALFVPAGAFLVVALARWRGWWALVPFGLVALATYSVALEMAQLEVARIGRACDVTDMVDNATGAVIGVGVGVVLLPLLRPWRGRGAR